MGITQPICQFQTLQLSCLPGHAMTSLDSLLPNCLHLILQYPPTTTGHVGHSKEPVACSQHPSWAAWYNIGLLIELMPNGVALSFLFFSSPHPLQLRPAEHLQVLLRLCRPTLCLPRHSTTSPDRTSMVAYSKTRIYSTAWQNLLLIWSQDAAVLITVGTKTREKR